MKSILIVIVASIFISAVWIIKAKTCHIYYYLAFNPERNTPQKAAWLITIIISLSSVIFW